MLKDLLEEGLERSMAKLIEKGRDKVTFVANITIVCKYSNRFLLLRNYRRPKRH